MLGVAAEDIQGEAAELCLTVQPACNPPYREIAYSRMNLQPGVIVAHTTGPTIVGSAEDLLLHPDPRTLVVRALECTPVLPAPLRSR